jgi:hypothetical protein
VAGKPKGRTQAQIRYDKGHPSWSARVDMGTHKRLEELARQRGVGRAELLRILAGTLPDLSPDESQKRRVDDAVAEEVAWYGAMMAAMAMAKGPDAVSVLAWWLETATGKDGVTTGARFVEALVALGQNPDEVLDSLNMYVDSSGGLSQLE